MLTKAVPLIAEASRAARKAKDHAPLFGKKGSVLDLFGKQAEKAISDCPVCNAKVSSSV